MNGPKGKVYGVLGEFEHPGALLEAGRKVREAGYTKFDCHSPFPVHGMEKAMAIKRSPLGYFIAIVAFFAMCAGLGLQWYANAVTYPLVISGKPFISYPSYAPVGFGITVLLSGICTFIFMLALNGLPRLFHPVFFSERFSSVTDDGFFVSIEHKDPKFDPVKTKSFLESIGAQSVEMLQG